MTVEKVLSEAMIAEGWIRLSEREASELDLPSFTGQVEVITTDEEVKVEWNARTRLLTGEALMDLFQLYGQAGWLVRLALIDRHNDSCVGLHLVERRTSNLAGQTAIIAPSAPAASAPRASKTTKRSRTSDRYRLRDRSEYQWEDGIGLRIETLDALDSAVAAGGWDDPQLAELRVRGEHLASVDQFDELLAIDVIHVDRMPHQEAAARKVLSTMNGRGILADEVGLGKTIEAGLIIKELSLRGLIDKVLVLCPAPLRHQWKEELQEKFGDDFDVLFKRADLEGALGPKLIMTPQLARSNAELLRRHGFDLILVDEVHKAKGAKTRSVLGTLTSEARYCLFLTATPVQNELVELYHLVELLRPGTFASERAFRQRYLVRGDARRPREPEALRQLVADVIVRTTRAQAGLDRVKRRTRDIPITLDQRERRLYDLCLNGLRFVLNDVHDIHRRRQLALRMTTSPSSLAESALRMASKHPNPEARRVLAEIAHLAGEIDGSTRERVALQTVKEWVAEHGRVIVFSQHTATITGLARFFEAAGLPVAVFHGDMSHDARRRSVAEFKAGTAKVLLSSDAGAEGQNLQFCNCVVNYDLPWNPMRIEQRIGRVDRMTQPKDEVFVANLFARDAVDEHVYRLLHDKLAMFELLFGQVTTILGELDDTDGATFESRVLNALLDLDDDAMRRRLERFGTELANARAEASTTISGEADLSTWLSDSKPFEHRTQMVGDARELMPSVSTSTSTRQRDLRRWIGDYVNALNVPIIHQADDFLSVRFAGELAEQFGTDELHLAFGRSGLEAHPDAELCAVGSEVFDLVLDTLRYRGDLVGRMAPLPSALDLHAAQQASDSLELVDQRVESRGLQGVATLRVQVGNGTERVVQLDVNGGLPDADVLQRCRPLVAGENITGGLAAEVRLDVSRSAIFGLADTLVDLQHQSSQATATQQRRLGANIQSRLEELSLSNDDDSRGEATRLRQALASLGGEGLGSELELRCDVLQLNLVFGGVSSLVQDWRSPEGQMVTVRRAIDARGAVEPLCSPAGRTIRNLAFCQRSHLAERSDVQRCPECLLDRCEACAPQVVEAACRLCERTLCSGCVKDGLCRRCLAPVVVEDLDPALVSRFCAGGSTVARVPLEDGELLLIRGLHRREAVVLDPEGNVLKYRSLAQPAFADFARGIERTSGYPADVEIRTVGSPISGIPGLLGVTEAMRVFADIVVGGDELGHVEFGVDSLDHAVVESALLDALGVARPEVPEPASQEERAILNRLFSNVPLTSSVSAARCVVELALSAEGVSATRSGLTRIVSTNNLVSRSVVPFEMIDPASLPEFDPPASHVFRSSVGPFTLWRATHGRAEMFALDHPDRGRAWLERGVVAGEADRLRVAASFGSADPLNVVRMVGPASLQGLSNPRAELVSRSVQPEAKVVEGRLLDSAVVEAAPGDVVGWLQLPPGQAPTPGPAGWSRLIYNEVMGLLANESVRVPAALDAYEVSWMVEDRWSLGEFEVEVQYVVPPGETVGTVEVDDQNEPSSTFVVCDEGHWAANPSDCVICGRTGCAACANKMIACSRCGWTSCQWHGAADGQCGLCAKLVKVSRGDAKRAGLDAPLFGQVWMATLADHHVAVLGKRETGKVLRKSPASAWTSAPGACLPPKEQDPGACPKT